MKDQKSPGQLVHELAEKYSHLSNSDFIALCLAIDISAPDPTGGVMIQLELPLDSQPFGVFVGNKELTCFAGTDSCGGQS